MTDSILKTKQTSPLTPLSVTFKFIPSFTNAAKFYRRGCLDSLIPLLPFTLKYTVIKLLTHSIRTTPDKAINYQCLLYIMVSSPPSSRPTGIIWKADYSLFLHKLFSLGFQHKKFSWFPCLADKSFSFLHFSIEVLRSRSSSLHSLSSGDLILALSIISADDSQTYSFQSSDLYIQVSPIVHLTDISNSTWLKRELSFDLVSAPPTTYPSQVNANPSF